MTIREMAYEVYLYNLDKSSVETYGYAPSQNYPKETERVAIACYDVGDPPEIAAEIIANHFNNPPLISVANHG